MREFEPEDTGIFLQDGEVGLFVVEDAPTFRIVGGVDELAGFVFAEVKAALVADLGEEGADVFLPLPFYGGAIKIDPRVLRWLS